MDVNVIIDLIGNVGFPIACCVAIFWYAYKQSENHKAEVVSLTEVIADLKIAITELVTIVKSGINK